MFGMVRDPVCKAKIKKTEASATSEYQGKLYYFCSEKCRDKFDKNPDNYR